MVDTIGPVPGVAVHVELGYYPEDSALISRWDKAHWDTAPAAWESGTPPFDDVSCLVESVQIATGRDQPLDRFRASNCTVTLNDPDGKYSPWATAPNPTSYTTVRPGNDLRVWVETDAGTYPRFTGKVNAINDVWPDPSSSLDAQHRVIIQAHDLLGEVAAYDGYELAPAGAGELTGARVARILNNAHNLAPRELDAGTVTVQATTLAKNAADEIGITTDTERGAFFATGDGRLRFLDRNGLHTNPAYTTVQAVFGEQHDEVLTFQPFVHAESRSTPYTTCTPLMAIDTNVETWWEPVTGAATRADCQLVLYRDWDDPSRLPAHGIRHHWYDENFIPYDYTISGFDGTAWHLLVDVRDNTKVDRTDYFRTPETTFYAYNFQVTRYGPDTEWGGAYLALRNVEWLAAEPPTELCYTDIVLASDDTEIRNAVGISRVEGTMAHAADLTSQAMFGIRTHRRTDLIHETDAESAVIAQEYLDVFAYAANRVDRLTASPSIHPGDIDRLLALGVLHLIEVRRRTRGFQVVAELQIQSISEQIDPGSWVLNFDTFTTTGVFDVGRWDRDTWGHGKWGY